MSAGPGFQLRPMRAEDLAQVHQLEQDIFPTPWSLNSYKFELEQNIASRQWVIEEQDEHIAAYIVCWMLGGDHIHIANLAVAPAYRRQGLARWLLSHALAYAAQAGAHSAALEVRAGNQAARALYASFGFQVAATRKGYYQDNREDALLMHLAHLETVLASPNPG